MVSKSKRNLQVTQRGDTVSIHKWFGNAGRFMSFTREEAISVSALLQEVLQHEQLSGDASSHPQGAAVVSG